MTPDDRERFLAWFDANRSHSRRLFDGLSEEAYLARPIPLRHPVVFYEGHLSAFNFLTIVRNALGRPPLDERLESLFARGIDPEDESLVRSFEWPSRAEVLAFCAEADERVREALRDGPIDDPANPHLRRSLAVHTAFEHEEMHHETLRYMLHRLPFEAKAGMARGGEPPVSRPVPYRTVVVPAGVAPLGAAADSIPFGWDNEFGPLDVPVGRFDVDAYPVTNEQFLDFVTAGGYQRPELWQPEAWRWVAGSSTTHPAFWERHDGSWMWRGMHRLFPLPPDWPVWVSQAEADAYARWRGRRLPTEAEFDRAAFGTSDRAPAWDGLIDPSFGNFGYRYDDPVPVTSHPRGASLHGIHDLFGNGWEWTASAFAPFPGFAAMPTYPPYSTDFFDGAHFVMKGASPATSRRLVRRTFRNWFRPNYPYVYAKFRTVRDVEGS